MTTAPRLRPHTPMTRTQAGKAAQYPVVLNAWPPNRPCTRCTKITLTYMSNSTLRHWVAPWIDRSMMHAWHSQKSCWQRPPVELLLRHVLLSVCLTSLLPPCFVCCSPWHACACTDLCFCLPACVDHLTHYVCKPPDCSIQRLCSCHIADPFMAKLQCHLCLHLCCPVQPGSETFACPTCQRCWLHSVQLLGTESRRCCSDYQMRCSPQPWTNQVLHLSKKWTVQNLAHAGVDCLAARHR